MRGVVFLLIFLLLNTSSSFGQEKAGAIREFTFSEFLQQVLKGNLEFMLEKYEVTAAEASVLAAKVFQDPELEILAPRFRDDNFSELPKTLEFELDIPVELFGTRKYRLSQAKAEKFAAEDNLEDFLRRLRADAASNFAEVLKNQLLLERMQATLEQWNRLVVQQESDREESRSEKIRLLQIQIETRSFQADILEMKSQRVELMAEIYSLLGGIPKDSVIFRGDLELNSVVPELEPMLLQLTVNRPDLRAAKHMVAASEFAVKRAQANRLPNINLLVGYFNEEAITPMPADAFYLGLIIPLKFSGLNPGEYRKNLSKLEQSELSSRMVLLEAEAELKMAWEKYRLLEQRKRLFARTILEDAQQARNLTLEGYQQGDTGLLSVLEAERTLLEVFRSYFNTLSEHVKAVIKLSSASGIWFIEFQP